MNDTKNYLSDVESDAKSTVGNYSDEIVEMLIDSGKASDDLMNDYANGDSYHHENHVDQWYSLSDAAELLEQLSGHTETDSGLWDSQEPREAISTQAAFTYGNAVMAGWSDLIERINDRWDEVSGEFDSLLTAGETLTEELPGLAWPDFAELKKQAAQAIVSEVAV